MLKPKTHIFILKFHLTKIQALNNKVNSKVHAYLFIDNEKLQFQGSPELKKNVAIFGSDLEYDNFIINYDEITGIYQNKRVQLIIQFQTQGAFIKIGQVNINIGEILNEKRYRVINLYPLSKCYDKTAKVKLSIDCIPLNQKRQFKNQQKHFEKQKQIIKSNKINQNNSFDLVSQGKNINSYKNHVDIIKSRLAEEENIILQQKLYQYEKRMDTYRIAQHQLSERMQQQLQKKDQKISQISSQNSKLHNNLHLVTLQNGSQKNQIRKLNQTIIILKQQLKKHSNTIQNLTKNLSDKQKQIQVKNKSLQNIQRTKQNKQTHLLSEIQKYTNKYSQSEQQRNKIIFQLENKIKQELDKKNKYYEQFIRQNQSKYQESYRILKQKNKTLENLNKQLNQKNDEYDNKTKLLTLQLQKSIKLCHHQQQQISNFSQQHNKIKQQKQTIQHQFQSLNFSFIQTQKQHKHLLQSFKQLKHQHQTLQTQLLLSNNTIQQKREKIILFNKQHQINEQRAYYMKQHYQKQLYDKQLFIKAIQEEKRGILIELKRVKEQMKMLNEKYQDQLILNQTLKQNIQKNQKQLVNKNAIIMKYGQQKIYLENQIKKQKSIKGQLESKVIMMQNQLINLNNLLKIKNIAIQNDKSEQLAYKIQSLQNDIQMMVQRFKLQKQKLKQQYYKQEQKKNNQINKLNTKNKQLISQYDELKKQFNKNNCHIFSLQKSLIASKQNLQDIQKLYQLQKDKNKFILQQKQTLQQKIKQLNKQKKLKQIQYIEIKNNKQKVQQCMIDVKNQYNRIIGVIIDYMNKNINQRVIYQDVLYQKIDNQMINHINLALKKFCEDHNKTRDLIRSLDQLKRTMIEKNQSTFNNFNNNQHKKYYQNLTQSDKLIDNYKLQSSSLQYYQQKNINNNNNNIKNNKLSRVYHSNYIPMMNNTMNGDINYQNQQIRNYQYQLDKYKKDQAQYKVKIRQLEQENQKNLKTIDDQKFQTQRIKNDYQQALDQITNLNFTIRKKDKNIKELERQIQDLQKQNLDKNINQSRLKVKSNLNNNLSSQDNHKIAQLSLMIKDLQTKLILKNQQMSQFHNQIQRLRQQYLCELNEIKKLQQKLKQKNNKIILLEKQLQFEKSKQVDNLQRQLHKSSKNYEKLNKQLIEAQNQIQIYKKSIKQVQSLRLQQENKNMILTEQIKNLNQKINQIKVQHQNQIKQKLSEFQTEIIYYKSQISRQNQKIIQLDQKITYLTNLLSKKSSEVDLLTSKLSSREKQFLTLLEQLQELKNTSTLKLNQLNDKIRQYQINLQMKSYELQQCKFSYQGKIMQLQKQIQNPNPNNMNLIR